MFQIAVEVIKTLFNLDGMDKAELLRFLERSIWPKVAYLEGRVGAVAQWVFVRLVLYIERKSRRGTSLKRTKKRLENKLQEMVRAANWRERTRRAGNVTHWVLQGLVTTPELAKDVARYESRGRTGEEQLWVDIVAAAKEHEPTTKEALAKAVQDAQAKVEEERKRSLAVQAAGAMRGKQSGKRAVGGVKSGERKVPAGATTTDKYGKSSGARKVPTLATGPSGGAGGAKQGKPPAGRTPRAAAGAVTAAAGPAAAAPPTKEEAGADNGAATAADDRV